ncbi:hypothetical protein MRB53_034416 [Persea americana]|uniref:Uncharacterized protein n=1 Tax=Persea americana TaxID=3435 RepID=A0ACC2K218_PERAE|nr:hypothetical protein MRB53_034416 [Persea americana]
MEEQLLYSLQLSQVELKETSKCHGKMLTEILQHLENLRSAKISPGKAFEANHVVVEPRLRHCSSPDGLIKICGSGQSVSSGDDLTRFGDPHLCNARAVGLGDSHPCNSGNWVLSDQENHHVELISMKDFVFLNENVFDYDAACSSDSSSCKYSFEGSDRWKNFAGRLGVAAAAAGGVTAAAGVGPDKGN